MKFRTVTGTKTMPISSNAALSGDHKVITSLFHMQAPKRFIYGRMAALMLSKFPDFP
jgi:hypothetical protein